MPSAFAKGSAFNAVKPSFASAFTPALTQSSADSLSDIPSPYNTVLTLASRRRMLRTVVYGVAAMRDLAMQISGVLAILVAVAHGVLGETRGFARAPIEPAWAPRPPRRGLQCGALALPARGVPPLVSPTPPRGAAPRLVLAR